MIINQSLLFCNNIIIIAINMKIRDLNSKVASIKREQQYQRVSIMIWHKHFKINYIIYYYYYYYFYYYNNK